jgi:predicted nucleic-acid-binding protein
MRAIDTNVLVRLIARDDPGQAEKAEVFVAKGAWVPHLVLAETLWVLETIYGLEHKQLAAAVEMLLAHRDLTLQDTDAVSLALESFRRRPSLGFSDCLIVEIARKAGHLPLGTFERGMSRLEGAQQI